MGEEKSDRKKVKSGKQRKEGFVARHKGRRKCYLLLASVAANQAGAPTIT